jgi:hypothetical protein
VNAVRLLLLQGIITPIIIIVSVITFTIGGFSFQTLGLENVSLSPSLSLSMWSFYGLNHAFAYACLLDASKGHYTDSSFPCNELSLFLSHTRKHAHTRLPKLANLGHQVAPSTATLLHIYSCTHCYSIRRSRFDLVSTSCLPGHFLIMFGALTSFSLSDPCLRKPVRNFFASALLDVVAGGA